MYYLDFVWGCMAYGSVCWTIALPGVDFWLIFFLAFKCHNATDLPSQHVLDQIWCFEF